MSGDHHRIETAALVMEYRACTEHYTALVVLNRILAQFGKPVEQTEAARLHCEAVRLMLANDGNPEPSALTTETATDSSPFRGQNPGPTARALKTSRRKSG
jgi:hypothetical protein